MLATLFGFRGRLSRDGFIEVLASVVLVDIAALLAAKYVQEFGLPDLVTPGGGAAMAVARYAPVVVAVFTAWTVLAASVKRSHDRNRTGWLVLLAIVPVIGWAWLLVDLLVLTGTKGRNAYGRAPFGGGADDRWSTTPELAAAPAVLADHGVAEVHAAHDDHTHADHEPAELGYAAHDDHGPAGHDAQVHEEHTHTGHDDAGHVAHIHHDAHHDDVLGHADDHHADDHHADDGHDHHVAADHRHPEPVHA